MKRLPPKRCTAAPPCVTAPASPAAFPPAMQVPHRTPRSLNLGSLASLARPVKRKLLILAVTLVLVTAAATGLYYFVVASRRPSMPTAWHQLRPGMPRTDVLSIVGTDTFDARSVKGCEITGVETSMAGMSSSWVLFLRYDASERLTAADAAFTNRVNSIFSLDEHSVFQ